MELVARRDAHNAKLHHLEPLPGRTPNGRFKSRFKGLSLQEEHWLDYMLSVLGFLHIQNQYVGLRNTTQSYARYELFRQSGMNHTQAIDRLLYGGIGYTWGGNGHASV